MRSREHLHEAGEGCTRFVLHRTHPLDGRTGARLAPRGPRIPSALALVLALAAALALALAAALPHAAAADPFGPFDAPGHPVTAEARPAPAPRAVDPLPPAHFFWLPFRFYNRFVSPIQGARCSHRPTCSGYAIGAVRRHGTVLGLWLTVDRLMLGGHSSRLRPLPMIVTDAGPRFLDPLDDALFWRIEDDPPPEVPPP